VPDAGSSSSGAARNADLAALPDALASQSLSTTQIILACEQALEAIEHLTNAGRRVIAWEGWVKFRDGTRAKSLGHGGSFALPRDATKAAEVAKAGIAKAQERWNRDPEYFGATLYFGLTFGDVGGGM
jgi:hypothetical protein